MTCLDIPELQAAFGRSNIPQDRVPGNAVLVDEMCAEQGVPPEQLGPFTEFSLVAAYRAPGGTPGVTDDYLLAVLDLGLVLIGQTGLFKKRADCQFMFFSEFEGGLFLAQESIGGRGWGHMDIQAMRGSVPLFRIGWYFDERSSDPNHAINAAANERDRILAAIHRYAGSGVS